MSRAGRILVVAGTDTEIGKTTVGCALLVALRARGVEVRAIKPVESGTEVQPGPEAEDGRRLAQAAGQAEPVEALQRLKAPLAPPMAARDEGVELEPERWLAVIREVAAQAQITLVEGAGGLLSPLAEGLDTCSLAVALEAEVLLVARDGLGTQNHTFLTLQALKQAGCVVQGIVFSAPEVADASTGRNAEVVRARYPDMPVASLPRIGSAEQGAAWLEEAGFVEALLGLMS